ncbi:glycoside hydrolase family 38 C-terminal domain-containing protein [Paenibacillus sp. 1P07SE]|uniref:glycoside hydrolase family 38 N-terminal domain-containing protein n=1 Tax=Paenibacillus sp. 1P07SE TaxID=3132209 RepID=UPI0039A67589
MNTTYHFIAHTHWDREWYLTFEQFRYRLVRLIDNLLDLLDRDPAFVCFHLDGQTIVLEDYYVLRPYNRERLESYIRSGRIIIGPWYQQNDLFLTSGESTVRNLMRGIADSRRLGGEMKVGYLPDHFGLIGQMPQILQQIGVDNAIFGRGYDLANHRGPLFRWEAPDGTSVAGILMPHWYNSAQRLPADPERLREMFDMLREREQAVVQAPHYVMMNGVDHLEAQQDLSQVLEQLRSVAGPGEQIVHSTLEAYASQIREHMAAQLPDAFETVQGELREGDEYSILAGTLSSRIYLKQANAHGHDLLEKWLEPLSLWCEAEGLDTYDAAALDYCWRLYMENHPHDSICGCSQDEVHAHMMDRYARLGELAEEMIGRKLAVLARQISSGGYAKEDQKLVVFNMAQLESRAVVRSEISFLAEDEVECFTIEAEDGTPMPYRVVSSKLVRRQVLSPVNLPGIIQIRKYVIEWQPCVPALGYAAYRIRPGVQGTVAADKEPAAQLLQDAEEAYLENEHLRIDVGRDGSLHMVDKASGRRYAGIARFEDSGDRGDLYVYKRLPEESPLIWDGKVRFTEVVHNDLYHECSYAFDWELPERLDESQEKRSSSLATCKFRVKLRLDREARHLKMAIEADNHARDHRLRLLLPLDWTPTHVAAGGQFDVLQRRWDEGRHGARDANSQPFWKWVAPVQETAGIALYAKGLHDYECLGDSTLAVTLHRGVDTIFLRETTPLEQDRQPLGQCLGTLKTELALRPFHDCPATRLYQEAELFHQGLRSQCTPIDAQRWNQGRPWVQGSSFSDPVHEADPHADRPSLPQRQQFLTITGEVMLSALKRSDRGDAVVRLYNVEAQSSAVQARWPLLGTQVSEANLLDERGAVVQTDSDCCEVYLPAKRIATYLVGRGQADQTAEDEEDGNGMRA